MIVRVLAAGDEKALGIFLAAHADSSMFLRSNLRAAGLVDHGQRHQATYVAAIEGERIVGVAAHGHNGTIVLQAPAALADVVAAAVDASGRAVRGLLGPWDQVVAARRALGRATSPTRIASHEILYGLDLERLRVPDALKSGAVRWRRAEDGDLELLAAWRAGYRVETNNEIEGPKLTKEARGDVDALHAAQRAFVLEAADRIVATSTFNAALPDIVQIGGVWTPPDLRGRGYARAVVAGSLLAAREQSVTRAVLFTNEDNTPARRAYEAIGFRVVGDYGIVGFASSTPGPVA